MAKIGASDWQPMAVETDSLTGSPEHCSGRTLLMVGVCLCQGASLRRPSVASARGSAHYSLSGFSFGADRQGASANGPAWAAPRKHGAKTPDSQGECRGLTPCRAAGTSSPARIAIRYYGNSETMYPSSASWGYHRQAIRYLGDWWPSLVCRVGRYSLKVQAGIVSDLRR